MIPRLFFMRIPFYVSFFLLFFVAGCTQKYQNAGSTIKSAFDAQKDVSITSEQVQNLPYASMFVQVNDKGRIFMVLAFAGTNTQTGNTQLKWLSADHAMIVTENGYIIKTIGFDKDNLVGLQQQTLPSMQPLQGQTQTYHAIYDWMPGYRYSIPAEVTRSRITIETITTELWVKDAQHIKESVTFPTLDSSIENEFWVDKDNQVIKSIQYLGPNMDRIEMLFIKPYSAPHA